MIDPVLFNTLRRFRAGIYGRFGVRRDALFDLLDAALAAGLVPSLAYLSLTPVHRPAMGEPIGRPGRRDDGPAGAPRPGGALAPG